VDSVSAAIAVAAAKELHRWQPSTDFFLNPTLQLTSTGKAQCSDGACRGTQALLDLQKAAHNTVMLPGGVTLDPAILIGRLQANWQRQLTCDSRVDNHTGDNCPAEAHKLTLTSTSPGPCDTYFTFSAKTPSGGALSQPGQLKNKLIFAGYPDNPYLAFMNSGDTVSIDPTAGLNEASTTVSGSCTAACIKLSFSSAAGQCCVCNGATSTYSPFAFSPYIFLCR
jgi:hypothetical protein